MPAQTHRCLPIALLLALALGLCHVVRARSAFIAKARQTEAMATQPVIDRTTALYHSLYPEARTLRLEVVGRADGQWGVEWHESDDGPRVIFTWDAVTRELIRCGSLRLPDADKADRAASSAIADNVSRTESITRLWLKHLGFADRIIKSTRYDIKEPFPRNTVRFVSCVIASRKILVGVDNVSGELKAFYHQPSAPAIPARSVQPARRSR